MESKKRNTREPAPRIRGQALSNAIHKKMLETGVTPMGFASAIGLSPSHTNALMSGSRSWDGTQRKVKVAVAKFLGVPLISVFMLAEIVEPEDFMFDDSLEIALDNAYGGIHSHPTWGNFCFSREEWDKKSRNEKILIALMYEKAMEVEILQKARLIKVVAPENKKRPRSKPGAR